MGNRWTSALTHVLVGATACLGWWMTTGGHRADATPPDPSTTVPAVPGQSGNLHAPSFVRIGEAYTVSGDVCPTGWLDVKALLILGARVRHPPVFPEPTSPTDIMQTSTGIEVHMVAGVTTRSDPLWYVKSPPDQTFTEDISVGCSLDGVATYASSNEVTVFPANGVAWVVAPINNDAGRATGIDVEVSSLDCPVGSEGSLRLNASGAARTTTLRESGGIATATFVLPFGVSASPVPVDYTFTCGSASSTFVRADWGFDVANGTLPSSGGTPDVVLGLAFVLTIVGVILRRLARVNDAEPVGWRGAGDDK